VARMVEMRNESSILAGKSEGMRQLGRPGRRWDDNIKLTGLIKKELISFTSNLTH
jgi:hypothetical protein